MYAILYNVCARFIHYKRWENIYYVSSIIIMLMLWWIATNIFIVHCVTKHEQIFFLMNSLHSHSFCASFWYTNDDTSHEERCRTEEMKKMFEMKPTNEHNGEILKISQKPQNSRVSTNCGMDRRTSLYNARLRFIHSNSHLEKVYFMCMIRGW